MPALDHLVMTALPTAGGVDGPVDLPTARRLDSLLGVVRILLLLQGSIAVLSTIEVSFAALALGPTAVPVALLSLITAIVMLALARMVGKRSRVGRRLAIWAESLVLLFAVVDLFLSLVLAQQLLEMVPMLTRFAMPYAIIRLLRRPEVLAEFGLASRRRRFWFRKVVKP